MAMVTLDNGAADGEADPHTATLSCVERIENVRQHIDRNTGAGVVNFDLAEGPMAVLCQAGGRFAMPARLAKGPRAS